MNNLKLLMVALFLGINIISTSQETFNTQKIAVFKNGSGFYIKSGNITTKDNKYTLKQIPKATFGTLWISAKGEKIKSTKTLLNKTAEKKDAENITELLKGNINKKVKIFLNSNKEYDGTIKSVKKNILNLQTKDKWVTTNISSIKNIEFYDKPNFTYEHKTYDNQIAIEFNSDGKKNINLMYMQKGIGWFPSYLIEINNSNKASVILKSTLINDIEDIKNTDISFVVGVPNFKYSFIESPLTSGITLSKFISKLNAGSYNGYGRFNNSNSFSNAIMTQTLNNNIYASNETLSDDTEYSSDFTNQEDLYFYSQKNVSLKKGERATFNILKTTVDFEHIYEVSVKQNGTDYYSYSKSSASSSVNTESSKNKVWHSIKLKNTSKMPWTTGTAMIMKIDNNTQKPISQDMMKYTPSGSYSYLKITVSPDITVKNTDKEIKKEEKKKKINNTYYDLITVNGSFIIKNFKNKNIKLNIKRNILGELIKSDIDWKFTKIPNYNNSLNPINKTIWEVNLKADEEKEIKYTYSIYVYH